MPSLLEAVEDAFGSPARAVLLRHYADLRHGGVEPARALVGTQKLARELLQLHAALSEAPADGREAQQ